MQAGAGTLLCHHEPSTTRHDGNAALPATGVRPIVPLPLAPVALPERRAPTADAIETQFGGIFYLLNVALALGLYGDFTMPRALGIALSPWDWLALVGLAWFGCDIERDPVWALLADLAGRAADEPPGRHFTPSNIQSLPADWLAPWGGVTRLEVHVERDRLQLWHGAGFVVMDVLLTRGSTPLIQARSLSPPTRAAARRAAGAVARGPAAVLPAFTPAPAPGAVAALDRTLSDRASRASACNGGPDRGPRAGVSPSGKNSPAPRPISTCGCHWRRCRWRCASPASTAIPDGFPPPVARWLFISSEP